MSNYPFPPVSPNSGFPEWREDHFLMGSTKVPVLDYLADKENFAWSDGLTAFHEDTAGENHFIDKASRTHALSELDKHIKNPQAVILEIGCSSGFMLSAIKKKFPDARVMGADIVRQPLEKLALTLSQIPLMRLDLSHCPLPDNSVDAIVMLNVLEHIEQDNKAMEQAARILKPGGVLIMEVPAGPYLYDIYDKMLLHFRRYTLQNLKAMAAKNGLKIKNASHLGCFMFPGFWLVKKRNRIRYRQADSEMMQKQVSASIRHTRNNILLNLLMKLELKLGNFINYPFGIRCIMTCVK